MERWKWWTGAWWWLIRLNETNVILDLKSQAKKLIVNSLVKEKEIIRFQIIPIIIELLVLSLSSVRWYKKHPLGSRCILCLCRINQQHDKIEYADWFKYFYSLSSVMKCENMKIGVHILANLGLFSHLWLLVIQSKSFDLFSSPNPALLDFSSERVFNSDFTPPIKTKHINPFVKV